MRSHGAEYTRRRSTGRIGRGTGLLLLLSGLLATPTAGLEPVLRVGTSGDYPPLSERVQGTFEGFDIAVAKRFAADEGMQIEWVPFRWPELLEVLARDRFDVGMSGITVRDERLVAGRFSVPVVEVGAVLLVPAGSLALRLSSLELSAQLAHLNAPEVRIGVNSGGHLERVTRRHLARATVIAIPNNAAVRDALAAGAVHAVVTDTLEAPHWSRGLAGIVRIGPFTRDRKAYLLPPDAAELERKLNLWLLGAARDGTLARLRAKWMPNVAASAPRLTPMTALLAAIDERLALMPYVADFKKRAGMSIVDPGREARVLAAAQAAVGAAAAAAGLPSPTRPAIESFYRAQIDAAVAVQEWILSSESEDSAEQRTPMDLETELRPALLRIGERMAFLLVRVAQEAKTPDLSGHVRKALGRRILEGERVDAIANAINALGR